MGTEDTWGKLQKNAKLAILKALVFGSNRHWREKISFKSIFYHLVCHLHLVNRVLAKIESDIAIVDKSRMVNN